MALKTSEPETEANDNNSEDDEKVGKTRGQGLLYTDSTYLLLFFVLGNFNSTRAYYTKKDKKTQIIYLTT
jgi:hypothetical protein